jgi:hypothetical protein
MRRSDESWYDVMQVCMNGHQITAFANSEPLGREDFCQECGKKTIDACQSCKALIRGYLHIPGIVDCSGVPVPKHCIKCGKAFPWTETALAAAKEYTDELDELSPEEKTVLKGTFDELTTDTAWTPLAANRFKKLMGKIGPVAGSVLQKIIETVATEAAKKSMGL